MAELNHSGLPVQVESLLCKSILVIVFWDFFLFFLTADIKIQLSLIILIFAFLPAWIIYL